MISAIKLISELRDLMLTSATQDGAYSAHACFDGELKHTQDAAAEWSPRVAAAAAAFKLYDGPPSRSSANVNESHQ